MASMLTERKAILLFYIGLIVWAVLIIGLMTILICYIIFGHAKGL